MQHSLEQRIHLEQVKLLYQNFKVIIPGNVFVGLMVISIVWDLRTQLPLLIWLALMLLVMGGRYLDARCFRQALQQENLDPVQWERHFLLGITLTGILWGVMFWMAFLPQYPTISLFIMCIYAGLVSAGTATSSARLPPFIVFVVTASLPLIASIFHMEGPGYVWMGLTCGVFMLTSIITASTYTRTTRESIRLRFQNMALISRLEQEKERAEQAVVIKDKFLAAASHDLRQPLHAQGLYLDALKPHVKATGQHALEALCKTSEALSNLFNSLLDVSRLNAGIVKVKYSHIELSNLVHPLATEYSSNAAKQGLTLQTDCDEATLFTDPILLERILRNLLSNALRYTEHGSITLSCKIQNEQHVRISVRDTGIGMPKHELNNIFTEYYQLANSERARHKGLGLGLAIVKKLSEMLDLKLGCQSVEGQGSEFYVYVQRGDPQQVANAKKPTNSVQQGLNLQILIIDDDDQILHSTALLLGNWGCQVLSAESAQQALEHIQQQSFQADVLIADYRLPNNKTGAEAIAQIRNYYQQNIPAMIVTGDTSPQRLQEAKASGLFLLHKPVAPGKLKAALRRLALTTGPSVAPP